MTRAKCAARMSPNAEASRGFAAECSRRRRCSAVRTSAAHRARRLVVGQHRRVERSAAPGAGEVAPGEHEARDVRHPPERGRNARQRDRCQSEDDPRGRHVVGGIGDEGIGPVEHAGDGAAVGQDVLGMEVAVADRATRRLRRAAAPAASSSRGRSPSRPPSAIRASSCARYASKLIVAAGERRTFAVQRPEQDLGVEVVEPRLRVDEDGAEAEKALLREGARPRRRSMTRKAPPSQLVSALAHRDAGRGIAEVRERVLDGPLAERPRRDRGEARAAAGSTAPSRRGVRRPGGRRRSGCRSPR